MLSRLGTGQPLAKVCAADCQFAACVGRRYGRRLPPREARPSRTSSTGIWRGRRS